MPRNEKSTNKDQSTEKKISNKKKSTINTIDPETPLKKIKAKTIKPSPNIIPIEASNYEELGNELNQLSNIRPYKIAILELSTKAVKMMWGEMRRLTYGFDFSHFHNLSNLTNTGDCLDKNSNLEVGKFKQYVLPSIESLLQEAKKEKITHLYCIGTAVFRNAQNIQEILDLLKKETNLEVKIISPVTEAQLSLSAFLWSSAIIVAEFKKDIIMMDQGGGSVQICWFERDENLTYSLNTNHDFSLGTTTLKKMLLNDFANDTPLEDAFQEMEDYIDKTMGKYFKKLSQEMGNAVKSCFAMGTAITKATGKTSNRNQHLTHLTKKQILDVIQYSEKEILKNYENIEDIQHDMGFSSNKNELEHLVIMRLGLPMYIKMMETWNVPEIVVSGTALRYGLYWQKLQEMKRYME